MAHVGGTRATDIACPDCGAAAGLRCGQRLCRGRIMAATQLTRAANIRARQDSSGRFADDDGDQLEELRALSRVRWPDWDEARLYEQSPMMFPLRCSVTRRATTDPGIQIGEEQRGDGELRFWAAVAGEFHTRPVRRTQR